MVASAERLADRLASKAGGGQVGEGWQKLAWEMYDAVPELRTAARITGQAMSQCRLVIARVTDGEPSPLDLGTAEKPGKDANHPAHLLLQSFAGGLGGQAAFLDMLGVHLTVTGESIAVGSLDTTHPSDSPLGEFATYSPDQVVSRNRVTSVKLGESMTDEVVVDEEDGGVTAVRIWRPNPRHSYLADSAAKAALSALNEIILYDQHIESSAISRLISAGIFAVPDGMTLPNLPAEDNGDDVDVDPFMRFLMQVMSTAIKDRKSAAARVPIMLRGDKEDIAAMKFFDFSTPFDDQILALRDAAINRVAVAVDMPGAILTGVEDTSQWTGALITQDWVNNYLQALMALACGSLTTGWMHKALTLLQGVDDYSDIIVWFDSSGVRVRENNGPEVQWAWENGVVNDQAARRILNFSDTDAPSEEEYQKHVLWRMMLKQPVLAPLVFPLLGFKFTPEQLAEATALSAALHPTLGVPTPGDESTNTGPGSHIPGDPSQAVTGPATSTPATNPGGTKSPAPSNPAITPGTGTALASRRLRGVR